MTRYSKCRKTITCLAIALWVSCSTNNVKAGIINVPGGFASIAQAVQYAGTGDTILLSPGTYTESNIDILIPLTISSEWILSGDETSIDRTIIDATSTILFSVYSDDVEISGLKILNGDHTLNINARATIRYNHMENNLDPVSMETGGGGYVGYNLLENNKDDGIDLDISISGNDTGSDIIIEHNAIINSEDDGIEIRLFASPNQNIRYTIRHNTISGSRRAGIQLISYDVYTGKFFDIHHNIIRDCKTAIGCMGGSNTTEDLSGAPLMDEIVLLYNNTFLENEMGATGGNSMIAINNVVANNTIGGFKRFGDYSAIEYNLFFDNNNSNLIEISGSAVQSENIFDEDPQLDAITWIPINNSPCIDGGLDKLVLDEITVIEISDEEYAGTAPDIGAMESEGESAIESFNSDPEDDPIRNFPNPFRMKTNISIIVSYAGHTIVDIYDMTGRKIHPLFEGILPLGRHSLEWSARDDHGYTLPGGIYIARLSVDLMVSHTKMLLLY